MRIGVFFFVLSILWACKPGQKAVATDFPVAPPPLDSIPAIERGVLDLVEFHIYDDPSGIRVYWATEEEENTLKFYVERSSNGTSWELIGTQAAAGNTSERTPYRQLDPTPFSGNNFYRVALEYADGRQVVSEVKNLQHFGFFNLQVFPNPALIGQQITLRFEGEEHHEFQIEIVDQYGMRIQRESFESDWGTNQLSFTPRARIRGKYFIYVFIDDYPVQAFTLKLR